MTNHGSTAADLDAASDLLRRYAARAYASRATSGTPKATALALAEIPGRLEAIRQAAAQGDQAASDWLALSDGLVRQYEALREARLVHRSS